MKNQSSLLNAFCSPIIKNDLFFQLLKREIQQRYRGSILGSLWQFVNPLLLLSAYTIVFTFIFEAKWEQKIDQKGEFAVILFTGLIVYNIIVEMVNVSSNLIRNQPNLVKKVIFPLEMIPWVALANAMIQGAISLVILILMKFIIEIMSIWPNLKYLDYENIIPMTTFLLPVVWLQLIGWGISIGWFLSATGVYLKDIGQLSNIFSLILLFMSPIFYPIERLPDILKIWLEPNPLAQVITQTRDIIVWGRLPNWQSLFIYTFLSFVCAFLSLKYFQKLRSGFADVL
jgi:lipopolysaccharide transport system permease protein